MEKHVSNWFDVDYVPDSYVFSEEARPGKFLIPICESIPVIDLAKEKTHTINQILNASQDFGFFQVINHAFSEDVISNTVGVFKEIFDMHASEVPNRNGWIYTGSNCNAKVGACLWRENIKQTCHPLEESIQSWPQKPARYREVVAMYLLEIKKLSVRILELISEGLGLEVGYLHGMSEVQLLSVNNYPPCPDPSLTLGITKHIDPSLITILFQGDVCGLQVLKDGRWIAVGALPNAFVVNIGNQLEVISNGKLKSAPHRAVTNTKEVRTSIATFINPSADCLIQPAKVLVNELHPPRYKSILYKDYVYNSKAFGVHTDQLQKGVGSKA